MVMTLSKDSPSHGFLTPGRWDLMGQKRDPSCPRIVSLVKMSYSKPHGLQAAWSPDSSNFLQCRSPATSLWPWIPRGKGRKCGHPVLGMPGVGRMELFWDCLHLESSWSLVLEKHPHVGNSTELFTVGVFLHLLQLFRLLRWKKNLLMISHNLWGSAFDSPTEKRETKRLRKGPVGRCFWEGNVVCSMTSWGEGWSALAARGQWFPGPCCFIPSPQSNFTEENRPEHVLEGSGANGLHRGMWSRCQSAKNDCLQGPVGFSLHWPFISE